MQAATVIMALVFLVLAVGLSVAAVLFLWGTAWAMLCAAAWALALAIVLLRGL